MQSRIFAARPSIQPRQNLLGHQLSNYRIENESVVQAIRFLLEISLIHTPLIGTIGHVAASLVTELFCDRWHPFSSIETRQHKAGA